MPLSDHAARLTTRLLFLVAGFGYACWAPLVPFAKLRLGIDDQVLGVLLLCLGIGSIAAMLATGVMAARFGSRPVIIGSALALAASLALLPLAGGIAEMAAALAFFGAALGSLDVAMNLQAIEVEKAAVRPLMSGFHAFFSVGGFGGAAFMTWLLSAGAGEMFGTLVCSAIMLTVLAYAIPRIPNTGASKEGPLFALPRGIVLLIAILAAVAFLAEGALLDWGALYLSGAGLSSMESAGVGYMVFSIAMTIGRFSGDATAARFGDRTTLAGGSVVALLGFAILLTAASVSIALIGFGLIGAGCANVVPVLFRRAGQQTAMPPALAIAAITTTAYAGILLGPAAIGFIAQQAGLANALWMLAGLFCVIPLCARRVTAR